MGADAYAYVIAGTKCRRTKGQRQVTKYNPDTGVPYPKMETVEGWEIGGVPVPEAVMDKIDGSYKDANALKLFSTDCERGSDRFVGVLIAGTESILRGESKVTQLSDNLIPYVNLARDLLRAAGFPHAEVGVWLVPHASY